jgi:hypothetical protein
MAAMPSISIEDIERHAPDVLLPPDDEFAEDYAGMVSLGRAAAAESRVALVAICRNAMPWLPRTLDLVERTGAAFKSWSAFFYENDSSDQTKDVLAAWADGQRRQASLNVNGRPHLNGTIEPVRTHALAEYRAECQRWVRHGEPVEYVVVFDTDAWGGWSIDGVMNSIGWLVAMQGAAACMASYSWASLPSVHGPVVIHYDAFAARLNHWRRRDQQWFHMWHPAVGSSPVPFRSAFGQLAVYTAREFLAMTYSGEDCEHVCAHRTMPGRLFLNPSSRCVSFWAPTYGGQHEPD